VIAPTSDAVQLVALLSPYIYLKFYIIPSILLPWLSQRIADFESWE